MGSWKVLKSWREGVDDHEESALCLYFSCYRVVEQHQEFPTGAPEFTITVKYQTGGGTTKPSDRPGWRWILTWRGANGQETRTGYGYESAATAKVDAEELATHIAKLQQPEEVYKFTPEV